MYKLATLALAAVLTLGSFAIAANAQIDVTTWTCESTYPLAAYQYDPVATDSHIYVVGGWDGDKHDEVYFVPILAGGGLGDWQPTTSLPELDQGPGAAIHGDWIYVITEDSRNVYRAQVQPDGELGTWIDEGVAPGTHSQWGTGGWLNLEIHDGRLYSLGNVDTTPVMYFASLDPNGALGPWQSTSAPARVHHHSLHAIGGRMYIVGGILSVQNIADSVYSAPINADGTLGDWRAEASLPHPLWVHSSVVVGDRIYLFGGRENYGDSGANLNIYEGIVESPDGAIAAWTDVANLPGVANEGMGSVYVESAGASYLIGGRTTTVPPEGFYTTEVWRTCLGCQDCNANGVEDNCELQTNDCNQNGIPDDCDIADGTSIDSNGNGIPDECDIPGDVDGDGCVDLSDLALLLSNYARCVYPQ